MFKKILLSGIILFVSTLFFNYQAAAKVIDPSTDPSENLPEKSGVYAVPGHPELRLRVFVHPTRDNHPGKPSVKPSPTPTPPPTLNCSLTDPGSDAVNDITEWHLPSTFTYHLNTESVPVSVGSQNLGAIVGNSFNTWTSVVGNDVNIYPAGTTSQTRARYDGQNIISWGRASSGTLGVTYTWYYTGSGLVAETDTIMNKGYPWSWSDPSSWGNNYCAYSGSFDAQNIMTHELGHWFGVDDAYTADFKNNTMYGYGDVEETKKDTLTNGDITAVQNIYPY